MLLPKNVSTKLGSTKITFEGRCTLIIREPVTLQKRTREQEIVTSEFKQYSIMLSYYDYRRIIHYYFFLKYGGYIKCETTVVKKYSKDLEQDTPEIPPTFTISNANKRISDLMKEKLISLVEEYREINSKPK